MKHTSNASKHRVVMTWMLGISTLLITQPADAQPRWGRPGAPREGACFYREANFRGSYFCAAPGENISLLTGRMNDQISSIRTFGDTEVTIFQDPRFRGRWTRIEGNVRSLRREGWNDRLSSIRVAAGWGRGRGANGDRSWREGSGIGRIETGEWREDRDDRRDDRSDRRGDQGARRDGSGLGRNDQADRRDGTGVNRSDQTSPQADRRDGTGTNRNGQTSSPQAVTPQQQAEAIVARAYRAELGREPDPASRVYVDKILRERWTEADVARALRDSPEYRNKIR